MKRTVFGVMLACVVGISPFASAQLYKPVLPPWTGLVLPEVAKANGLPEQPDEIKACFEVHGAALTKKPQVVAPLVADYFGADTVRRECAIAAEVALLMKRWSVSSPVNAYGPLISAMNKQNQSLATKSDMEKCQGKQFIFDAVSLLNGMMGGMIPRHVYSWVEPAAGTPCVAASP